MSFRLLTHRAAGNLALGNEAAQVVLSGIGVERDIGPFQQILDLGVMAQLWRGLPPRSGYGGVHRCSGVVECHLRRSSLNHDKFNIRCVGLPSQHFRNVKDVSTLWNACAL